MPKTGGRISRKTAEAREPKKHFAYWRRGLPVPEKTLCDKNVADVPTTYDPRFEYTTCAYCRRKLKDIAANNKGKSVRDIFE